MEVASAEAMENPATPATPATPPPPTAMPSSGADAVRDMTLKDIIHGMKKRSGAARMPSAVQRTQERRKRRRREAAGLPPQQDTPTPQSPPVDAPATEDEVADAVVAPQMTIDEDGNIVIDQESLVVSAGVTTTAEAEGGDVTVENHTYLNHVTSASYAKRELAQKWGEDETDKFYGALRKFGTDFSLMESAFPGRTRKQLKLKFKREEKEFSERVDSALSGPPEPIPLTVQRASKVRTRASDDDADETNDAQIGGEATGSQPGSDEREKGLERGAKANCQDARLKAPHTTERSVEGCDNSSASNDSIEG